MDSGQLMVCDPCYIGAEWIVDETPREAPTWIHQDGRVFYCSRHGTPTEEHVIAFDNFEEPMPGSDMTFNQAIAAGILTEVRPKQAPQPFSYSGCCGLTLYEPYAGQMHFNRGHAGAGVAFSSGYGDGCYPVYARYNEDGRIVEVRILMDDDECEA